jgi:hypothetical protein
MRSLDITDLEEVEQTIKKYGVKSIIHAASVYEGKGTLYDAMRANIVGTINILEASVRNGISRISALSSEAVYQGIKQKEPLKEDQLLGVGAGQMSRVDSVRIAIMKARFPLKGAAMASDAFFPFRDNVDECAKAGATAIVQPGGSIRDGESIKAADEHGIAMIFTGFRHFRH